MTVLVADERDLPGKRQTVVLARVEVRVQRVEVARGEGDVELLHTAPVVEHALDDGLANGQGDPPVEDREVADVALAF